MKLSEAMEAKSTAPAKAETPKSGDKKNRGALQHVAIEPAENGYSVRCTYAPKKGSKSDSPMMDYPGDEKYVFESAKAAADYVGMILGETD
jgi:hypothetical protein